MKTFYSLLGQVNTLLSVLSSYYRNDFITKFKEIFMSVC